MARAKRRRGGRVSAAARQGSHDQQKKFIKYGLGGMAVAAVVLLIAFAVATSSGGSGVGDTAADFDFSLYQGTSEVGFREGNLASLHGQDRPMVLNFWAGLCPPCRAEMPQFQAFYEEFNDEILVLGIDIGPFMNLGTHGDADALLRELGVTYPTGWTDDGSVPRKFGVTGMPTTVFLTSDGEIFEKAVGAIDANRLARSSKALMAAEAEAEAAAEHGS
ncbi:MAG: hypothetical protein BZY87_02045 [SAR202 cluster bacterium Io17-Chloro-G6]|nr:MAG: hypothetical protein BZY87_02045 [SAR202 cluster bacterium Io17-Chloro-G6]